MRRASRLPASKGPLSILRRVCPSRLVPGGKGLGPDEPSGTRNKMLKLSLGYSVTVTRVLRAAEMLGLT